MRGTIMTDQELERIRAHLASRRSTPQEIAEAAVACGGPLHRL